MSLNYFNFVYHTHKTIIINNSNNKIFTDCVGGMKPRVVITILKASIIKICQTLRSSSGEGNLHKRWKEFLVEKSNCTFESLTIQNICIELLERTVS